ncbi:MAG: PQQ-binding-like beta-propeller repeat protein [Candidatus Hydrothermarchaeaceae archaeon]
MNKFLILILLFMLLPTVSAKTQPALFWSYDTGDTVNGVAISDNGNYYAAASDDGYVYFLNKSKKFMWKVRTDSTPLKVAISSDGSRVFVGDGSMVYLYNKTGNLIWEFYEGDSIQDLAITPSGDFIAAGSLSYYVYLLDGVGEMLWKYRTNAPVMSVAISSDGKLIAAGSSRGSTYLLDKNGDLLWEYSSERSIDGVGIIDNRVASGGKYLNFIEGGKKVGYYTGVICDISSISTTADSERMLMGCEDGGVHFLDSSKKKLWSYDVGKTSRDSSISFKGDYAAVAGGKTVYILTPPDITPPVVKITEPKDGATASGVVELDASVVEASSYTLRVLIDGNYACGKLPCSWYTGAAPEGDHTIAVEVNDSAGNVGRDTVHVILKQTLLWNITEEISEKQEAVKEKQEAIKEKLDGTLPRDLPPIRKHMDFGLIVKALILILAAYGAFKLLGRPGQNKYKWKKQKKSRKK